MSDFNDLASRFLGKKATISKTPDANLLQALPRSLARESYKISGEEFIGYDVWHAHEATFLLNNGLPICGMLKIVYSAQSPNIVESKSLKLYLNTFDLQAMGRTAEEGIANYERRVAEDLADCVGVEVRVKFFEYSEFTNSYFEHANSLWQGLINDYGYEDLCQYLDAQGKLKQIRWNELDSTKNYLEWQAQTGTHIQKFYTNILRTNCRVTKQKDSGYAFLYLDCENGYILPETLLKNIISLREAEEFHEFCAEKLFVELQACPFLRHCCVILLFARRGGIDINPIRTNNERLIPPPLGSSILVSPRTPMQ